MKKKFKINENFSVQIIINNNEKNEEKKTKMKTELIHPNMS